MTTLTMDSKVKQVISNIRNLPTPPIVFDQIQKVIKDPKCSAAQIAAVLSEDPAMSVKVLKLTNSAYYGLNREIESVKQAVVIVGLEAIKNLVLSASVLDMFKGQKTDQEFQDKFWRHSLAVAFCSRVLAQRWKERGIVDPDAAFSGGLLHDIGKIILCCFLPTEWAKYKAVRTADRSSMNHTIEQQVLGYDHAQIGAILATQWKLPHKVVEAITWHHSPMSCPDPDPIVHLTYMANYIAKSTFYDDDERHLIGSLDPDVIRYMGMANETMATYSDLLRQEYVKAETFMQMAGLR